MYLLADLSGKCHQGLMDPLVSLRTDLTLLHNLRRGWLEVFCLLFVFDSDVVNREILFHLFDTRFLITDSAVKFSKQYISSHYLCH